jgi:uncharacterized membrane protein
MKELPDSTRLETFSDGVFAIAVTLLIFQVKVPDLDEVAAAGGLWRALGTRWPSYLGYVISFLTLGIMWVNHHAIFQYVRRVDRRFLLVNILFLMGIAFLPFPTAVLADYLTEQEQRVAATMFYGGVLVAIAVLFNLVWWAGIQRRRLLGTEVHAEGLDTISRRYRLGPVGYLVATALALVNVWASLAVHVGLALLFARPERAGA